MKTYTEILRQLAANGKISLEDALKAAAHIDSEREATRELLKNARRKLEWFWESKLKVIWLQ